MSLSLCDLAPPYQSLKFSRLLRYITLLVLPITLVGCAPTLDPNEVATQIQTQLSQPEEIDLKTVICPGRIAIAKDTSFICKGELSSGGTFPIQVTQIDEQGSIQWEIPNSKGLLNLSALEAEFEQTIATETGIDSLEIDCGGNYRVNRSGDRFECRIINANPIQEGQAQTLLTGIVVNLDSEGNVAWQQLRQQQVLASASPPSASTPVTSPASRNSSPKTNPSPQPSPVSMPNAQPSPTSTSQPETAAETADDFLNNPNAMDGF